MVIVVMMVMVMVMVMVVMMVMVVLVIKVVAMRGCGRRWRRHRPVICEVQAVLGDSTAPQLSRVARVCIPRG